MTRPAIPPIHVYLEIGARRTIAAALDWPGWCRSGRDEAAALQALLDWGPRYARIVRSARLSFQPPAGLAGLAVVERLAGNATTDFGAPGRIPAGDTGPLEAEDLRRLQAVLKACWRAFDAAVAAAEGQSLRTGPRGGGRQLDGIVQHVREAEAVYLAQLGGPAAAHKDGLNDGALRLAIHRALAAAARGEIAALGPRGGKRWPPRYFVRRAAWHVLDHIWEIEDRQQEAE